MRRPEVMLGSNEEPSVQFTSGPARVVTDQPAVDETGYYAGFAKPHTPKHRKED